MPDITVWAELLAASAVGAPQKLGPLDDLSDDYLPTWVRQQLAEVRACGELIESGNLHVFPFAFCEACAGLTPCQFLGVADDESLAVCAVCDREFAPPIWWAPRDVVERLFGPHHPHPFPKDHCPEATYDTDRPMSSHTVC